MEIVSLARRRVAKEMASDCPDLMDTWSKEIVETYRSRVHGLPDPDCIAEIRATAHPVPTQRKLKWDMHRSAAYWISIRSRPMGFVSRSGGKADMYILLEIASTTKAWSGWILFVDGGFETSFIALVVIK